MSDQHGCDMVLLVQAEFDGELDAAQAARLSAHRSECAVCQAAGTDLARARALVRPELYQPAPDDLRERVLARLRTAGEASAPQRRGQRRFAGWRPPAFGFGLGAACAAAVMLLVLSPAEQSLTEQVVAGHVRALQPGHLEDVPSTDQHTVKPWFDGRLDFAPPVRDLAGAGFPLKGGRLDYIGGRPVAALVYQRDKHIIDLFIWPAGSTTAPAPIGSERNGYNVVHWVQDGMNFWAVSDVEQNQLRDFSAVWRHAS
ncbi:MAG TPA: anti-sigma factor [Stellaceae bacterium]|jgi:anti-sigma factor RsiW|nr:anti-sigma factor [Stellaceae bacterium]